MVLMARDRKKDVKNFVYNHSEKNICSYEIHALDTEIYIESTSCKLIFKWNTL